ncbi:MAG: hypothetical protein O3A00_17120 [Planctomycetota bacterium]|nr:hypothetical protein [Planctomycetota bacterium]
MPTSQLPKTIRRQLARLRCRERTLRLCWGAARWLAIVSTVLALACLMDWTIDRLQDTPWGLRASAFFVQAVLWTALGWLLVIRPLVARLSDRYLALRVEDRMPKLDHRLITAVELNHPEARIGLMSPALIDAVTGQAESVVSTTDLAKVMNDRRLRWSMTTIGPCLLLWVVLFAVAPVTTRCLLARQLLADCPLPRAYSIEALTPETVRPMGEEVVLRFRVRGPRFHEGMEGHVLVEGPQVGSNRYRLVAENLSTDREGVFLVHVPPVDGDFEYTAYLGDGRTHRPGKVHFEPRPEIVDQRVWVQMPVYCGVRPDGRPYEEEQPRGNITGLRGATARLTVRFQKPVVRARVQFINARHHPTRPVREINLSIDKVATHLEATFELRPGETDYQVTAEDKYGFGNFDPPRRSIRVIPEDPPVVVLLPERFLEAGDDGDLGDFDVTGMPVPLGKRFRIAYRCAGRWGLGRAEIRYRVNDGVWQSRPLVEVDASSAQDEFDPQRGAFVHSGSADQIEFFATPWDAPEQYPGRTSGGGRFDFRTDRLHDLKTGDRIEFFIEMRGANPNSASASGRSETRTKTIVSEADFLDWVSQAIQEEIRLRELEIRQRAVFHQPDGKPADKRPG